MSCFKDKTFCASPHCTNQCGRKLTDEERSEFVIFNLQNPEFEIPLCTGYFCDDLGNPIQEQETQL